jgi:hypothetical protein
VEEQQADSGDGEKIDWEHIVEKLHRSPRACQQKWDTYQRSLRTKFLKKGPFSPQEDAVIIERVSGWDKSKKGLWVGLERELGRAACNITNRWRKVLSKR